MPKDFRKKTFSKILRGYAPEEVDAYLAYIHEEYRKLERRCVESERKLAAALMKIEEQAMEQNTESQKAADEVTMEAAETAQRIIAEAEDAAERIRQAAAVDVEQSLRDARDAASAIRSDAKKQIDGMYQAAAGMYDEVCSFRDSLFELYNSHIEAIEGITETAKSYVNTVDGQYSEAAGTPVSHDEIDEDEEDDLDDAIDTEEETTVQTAEEPDARIPQDLYIDLAEEDEPAEDSSGELPDVQSEELPNVQSEELPDVQIDWKNRRAVMPEDEDATRVLDLSALRDAEDFAESDDFSDMASDFADMASDAAEDVLSEDEDFESEEMAGAFREMDSLFTDAKTGELSLTDEFDIVFSGVNSKKNIDEIRRQPIVPAEEPKKPKKHQKF